MATYTSGEFSFDYPSSLYTIEAEETDGPYTSFFLRQIENPSNRIEFSIYRYEPEFVATILPDQLAGEIRADVMDVGTRATAPFEITEQSGLIVPETISFPYKVSAIVCLRDDDGNEAVLRISSIQIAHYNVINLAWGDTDETVASYAAIFSTFRVRSPEGR